MLTITSSTFISLLSPKQQLQDRFDEPCSRKSPLAIDALITFKSAPVQGHPMLGNLISVYSDLDWRRPDLGLLDIFVDDGTNGNLDETLRSVRFSAAASNIHRLFTTESKQTYDSALSNTEHKAENKSKDQTEDQFQKLKTRTIRDGNVMTEPIAREPVVSQKESTDDDAGNHAKVNLIISVKSPEDGSDRSKINERYEERKDIDHVSSGTAISVKEKAKYPESEPVTPMPAVHNHQVEYNLANNLLIYSTLL